MAKLLFHIGAHKTATSYLQGLFYHNADLLAAGQVWYPRPGPNLAHHALGALWLEMADLPAGFFGTGGPEGLWDRLIRDYAGREGTVFLSAENFSRLQPQKVDMADLAQRLRPFDEVKIVCTLRQQTDLVTSIWSEVSKGRPVAPPVERYLSKVFRHGLAGGVPVDHQLLYDHLLTGFAPEQIHFLDYETISRGPGGVPGAFLALLGHPVDAAALRPVAAGLANISPDPLSLWLATQIWPGETPDPQRIALIRSAIAAPGQRSTWMSRREAGQIAAQFQPGNAALVARVQAVQPGFALTETPLPADLLCRDMISPAHWARIAARLYEAPPAARTPARALARRLDLSRLRRRLRSLVR